MTYLAHSGSELGSVIRAQIEGKTSRTQILSGQFDFCTVLCACDLISYHFDT